ncbi:ribosome dissociation factor GTPase [Saccharomycopsis crataegensis]|uniref:Elongation factor 1 alpha-like protein n=1 Tax=Saccharomycopsis crataegensis TaxID=43959 RepID=A0AAV5QH48_9ASCO|nr:ribosome dissociation factor GTPase [Saccharomycopsis crataegensis]
MATYLEEDDLHDYANDDYDEGDEISPEDDEKIQELIPQVKKELSQYTGFTYDDIYNEIWECYMEVDEAISSLKKKFKKKPSSKPAPKESKLAALAKIKKSKSSSEGKVGLSGLASRSNGNKDLKSISILDRLSLKNETSSQPKVSRGNNNLDNLESKPEGGSKLSKLAALRLNKGRGIAPPQKEQKELLISKKDVNVDTRKFGIGKEIKEDLMKTIQPAKENIFELPCSISSDYGSIFSKFSLKHELLKSSTNSSFSIITVKNSTSNPSIQNKVNQFDNFLHSTYLPVTKLKTNDKLIVSSGNKIKANFTKPSPDDIVLSAQGNQVSNSNKDTEEIKEKKLVEDITVGVKNLKIPKPTKPKKKLDLDSIFSNEKPNLSFAVIGHVDAGKSTLMGMFLKSLNKVNKNFLKKLEDESARAGKKSFALAWIMDQTIDERQRGVTVDICTTAVDTNEANFIIIDAPGHKDYVPRMISGLSQADIGLLIIDANYDGFESGFSYDGQTKEHALLSYSLGMKKLVIVMNKLDMIDYDEERYNDIEKRLREFLVNDVGFTQEQLIFVPVSGIDGTNVSKKPTIKSLTSWYPNCKPTLLEILENEAKVLHAANESSKSIFEEKFLFQISDISTDYHQASEFSITGRVNSGFIQTGETVISSPGGLPLQIDSIKTPESDASKDIEVYKERDCTVKFDNNVFLFFKDKKAKDELKSNIDLVRSGDLLSKVSVDDAGVIASTIKFNCELNLFDLRDIPLLPGSKVLVHSGGQERPAEITQFLYLIDSEKKKKKKKRILHLGSYKRAVVEVKLIDESTKLPRPIPLMTFENDERLGRIVFRRDGITIGAGKILELL